MEKNITKKLCSILLSFAIVLTSVCIPSVSVSAEGESAITDLATFAIDSSKDKWTDGTDVYWGSNKYSSVGPDEEYGSTMSDGSDKVAVRMSKDAIGRVTFTNKGSDKSISATVNVSVTDNTGNAKNVYTETKTIAAGDTFVFDGWKASQNYVIKKWSAQWNELDGKPSIVLTISAVIPVENVIITGPDTSKVGALKTVQLSATVEPSNATNQNVNWYSGNEKVATVENGLVTTKYPGTAVITAVAEDTSWATSQATRDVVVDYTKVQNFTLDKQKLELYMNGNDSYCPDEEDYKSCTYDSIVNYTLTSTVRPSDATYKTVTYSTKNNAPVKTGDTVATVNESTGYIEAVAPGTITVVGTTGMSGLDEQTAEVAVTVKVHTTGVEFVEVDEKGEQTDTVKTDIDIYEGETIDLAKYIKVLGYKGYDATNSDIELSYETASQDGGAVKFDGTKVIGVTNGKGTITVRTKDRGWTATMDFVVNKPVNGVTLKIDGDVNKVLWYNGSEAEKTLDIAATLLPQGYYLKYKNIEWSIDSYKDVNGDSLSTDIVSIAKKETTLADGTTKVDDKTAVLTLKKGAKAGTITVKITINNETDRGQSGGDKNEPVTETIDIKVQGYVEKLLLPESVEIYKNCTESDHTIDLSEKNGVLDFYVRDAYNKEVTWKSSDESVATVDENGVVTAVGYGTAKITATSVGLNKDGETVTSNECEVHVQLHPEDVAETKITGTKNPNTNVAGQVYYNSNADADRSTTLTVNLSPENAKYKNIVWDIDETDTKGSNYVTVTQDSQDKTLATVTVKGKESGVAQIRATITYEESGVEKTIVREYTVEVLGLVDSITSADGKKDITIYNNTKNEELAKATLEAVVNPEDAYLTTIDTTYGQNGGFYIWKASGSTASISLTNDKENVNKATIKALTPGKLEVMVASAGVTTTHSKHQLYTWNVNVVELVEGIELNKATTSIQEGSNETLVATIKNETASDKSVTWTSSDPSIATVDASGKVVAKKTGTVTITATANDKYDPDGTIGGYNKVATCKVTVTAKPAETKVVTCEEANGKGWVWSEAKKACVYKVTNTSAE